MKSGAFTQLGNIITPSGAVSGAAGSNLNFFVGSGNAAGNSNGGSLNLKPGAGFGTGSGGAVFVQPFNSTAGSTTELRFVAINATNYVSFKAPDTIAANVVWTLPAADGASSQVLQTNGAGVLSWVNQAVTRPSTAKTAVVSSDSFLVFDSSASNAPVYTTAAQVISSLNIVTASANGVLVRTAANTYASRTLTANTSAGNQGLSISNGDGVAGNPTIGLTISGLSAGTVGASTVLASFDGTNNVKVTPAAVVSARIARGTFTSASLTSNALAVTHNLAVAGVLVQVFDENSQLVQPDNITLTSTNVATIDLSSFGTIGGTWTYVIFG